MATDYSLTASVRLFSKLTSYFNRLLVEAAGIEYASTFVTHRNTFKKRWSVFITDYLLTTISIY